MSRWLRAHGLSFQRAREYLRSPDPLYLDKAEYLREQLRAARQAGEAVYFWDMMSCQLDVPGQAQVWAKTNSDQARALLPNNRKGHKSKEFKVMGALNAYDGRVKVWYPSKVDVDKVIAMLEELSEAEGGERIHVVMDNAPVHFHYRVFEGLEAQRYPFEYTKPECWTDPKPTAEKDGELKIQLIGLPTYSPWLNPIEKLWRMLRQRVLHTHEFAEQPQACKRAVMTFFDGLFLAPQPEIRSYTGLESIFPV